MVCSLDRKAMRNTTAIQRECSRGKAQGTDKRTVNVPTKQENSEAAHRKTRWPLTPREMDSIVKLE